MNICEKWIVSAAVAVLPALLASSARAGFVVFPTDRGGNGNSYEVVVDSTSSWTQANAAAQAAGGHLATLTSAPEDRFVSGLLTTDAVPTGSYWMGLRRTGGPGDGTFQQWTTGEPLVFTNWTPGIPDNYQGVENSGAILWTPDATGATFSRRGQWNDLPDSGYPNATIAGTPGQIADIFRGGYVIEREAVQSSAAPLPGAALLSVPGAALAAFSALRLRRHEGSARRP